MKLSTTKQRSTVFFFLSILILFSTSNTGYGQTIDPPLRERTPQIRNAIVAAVPGVNNADDVTAAHLAAITKLNPIFRGITSLKSGDFNGLTALTFLGLSANELTSLPPGIFDELTALTYLGLSANKLSALTPGVFDELTALKTLALSINKLRALPPGIFDELTSLNYLGLGANKLRALPPGIFNELTALKTLFLHSNNISDISELEGLTALTALQLSRNPISDYGPLRRLVAAITAAGGSLKLDITIPAEFAGGDGTPPAGAGTPAAAPVFTEGTTATRTVAENTASGTNIGTAVAATDADDDTLTYTLSGTDASSFSTVSTSGQLQTNAALDYETKLSYTVTVSVSDGKGGSDSIDVTINVTDVDENRAPAFTDGDNTTRSVAENTASEQDIGSAVSATDPDASDTLTYTLSGADAASFSINSTNGQLQTSATLDYETKKVYAVTITVSDTKLTDTIDVRINVTNVNEAPSFTESSSATRSIAENTASEQNIGSAVSATDADADTTLTYTLSGADAASFSIVSTSGQLQTLAALDFETKPSYSVSITVSDGQLTDSINVRINVIDVDENRAPAFAEGTSTTRSVAENTGSGQDIGSAVSATDPDNDTLTYTLGGTDSASFSINSTNGQLQTNAALDYETKHSYSVRITVSDSELTASIDVRIDVTDVDENRAPVFAEGTSTTRSVAENTGSGVNIGSAISATDADNDTLTYTLGGTDASSFSINSTNGQLQTSATLDYETKKVYAVTITVSDTKLTDTIDVRINVTNVNEAPSFATSTATRSIAENTAANTNIGSAFTATDVDADTTLTYTLGGADAASFSIVSTSGQLQTLAALDFETKPSYSVSITVSDGQLTDSIDVRIDITDVDENRAPAFTDGDNTTRSVAENTASGQNIGSAVSATDPDTGDVLTYTLSGADEASFSIVSTSGQLQTQAPLDYETKKSYTVTVSVSDSKGGSDSITVTINVSDVDEKPPRSPKTQNSAPVFTDGDSTTRMVAENKAPGTNIGNPIAATDADNDTLTYTVSGTDATSFDIVGTSGQLQTKAALDYETKTFYLVTVSVSDGKGGIDSITVTINVIDITESPNRITPVRQRTPQVRNAIVAAAGVRSPEDVSEAHLAAITLLDLSGKGITSLKSGDFDGLTALTTLYLHEGNSSIHGGNSISDVSPLQNLTSLRTLYLRDNSISDVSPLQNLTALIKLTMGKNSVSDISPLKNLTNLTDLSLYDNSISDISPLENLTSLKYLILDNNSISDISPLENLVNLDNLYLNNNSIKNISPLENLTNLLTLVLKNNSISDILPLKNKTSLIALSLNNNSISDISPLENLTSLTFLYLSGNPISDYKPLQRLKAVNSGLQYMDININNNPPEFTEGDSTTRTIAENAAPGTNIGVAVTAIDADNHTLIYSLSGTDADAFDIVSTSGQLQTNAALDYETKASYTVTVTVYDGNSGGDSITVTIEVTDVVNENVDDENVRVAPSVEPPPVIPENTALLTNFPNPFNPETWIPYQLAKPAEVTLTIYDIRGVVVRELKLGHQAAGVYYNRSRAIYWDGRNAFGEKVATGVYFYTLKAGDFTATRKLLIRK